MTNDHLDRRMRHVVQLDASVTRSDGETCACVMTDLSIEGCRIGGDFTIGERVELDTAQIGKLTGQIRWAFNGQAGVRFDKRDEVAVTAPR